MHILALIALILTIILFLGSLFLGPILTPVFNNKKFTIPLGIIMLLIFFFGKYMWYIIDLVNYKYHGVIPSTSILIMNVPNLSSNDIWSLLNSNIMLLNSTDMFMLFASLCLIFNGCKCVSKIVAIIGLVLVLPAALSTLMNEVMVKQDEISFYKNYPVWKYLFIGNGITRFHVISNMLTLFALTGIYMSSKQFSRWSIVTTIVAVLLLFLYWVLCVDGAHVSFNASGFTALDFDLIITYADGEILGMGSFLQLNLWMKNSISTVGFESITLLRLAIMFLVLCFIGLFITAKNLFTFDLFKVVYIYKPWYHRNFYFRDICYAIDAFINDMLWVKSARNYLYGIKGKQFQQRIKTIEEFNGEMPRDMDKHKVNSVKQTVDTKLSEDKIRKEKKKQKDKNQPQIVNQPYQDNNGKWWYLDESGQKFYADEQGSWILFN